MAEEKKLDEAAKPKAAKLLKFVCETKCYWNGELWREGSLVEVPESDKDKVPEHFALV